MDKKEEKKIIRFPTKSAQICFGPCLSLLPLSFFSPSSPLRHCPSVRPSVRSCSRSPRVYTCACVCVCVCVCVFGLLSPSDGAPLSPSCRSFSLVVPAIVGFSYVFVRPRCRAATYARVDEGSTQLHSRDVTFRGLVRTVCDGERGHRWDWCSNVLLRGS